MSRSIRTIAVHILATAQSSLAKANHVTVHRQLIGELREALGSPVETSSDRCYTYALKLLNAWVNRFGRPKGFEPFNDLYGVLGQIDNVVTGLLSDNPETSVRTAQEIAALIVRDVAESEPDLDDPGCMAVTGPVLFEFITARLAEKTSGSQND